MTVKWVKVDPLVMNGEPFCYNTRLTVRNLLEMRSNGLRPRDILGEHPELRWVGIAEGYRYATENRARYKDFFGPDGSLQGPGFTAEEAATLPDYLRGIEGVVTREPEAPAPIGA
jgi:uncharacterized protein (DUF433 family)